VRRLRTTEALRVRELPAPLFSIAAARRTKQTQTSSPPPAPAPPPSPLHLLVHRPLALISLVPVELAMFIAAGVAGAIAKTTTAPLDRVRRHRLPGGAVP